jgi:type II secretory pathway pseudopilin PulG
MTPRRRAAFTLLEILLAVTLSVVLLGVVYGAIHLSWKYSTAGQQEVERAQLARAILREIEADVRSVVYHEAAAVSQAPESVLDTNELDETATADVRRRRLPGAHPAVNVGVVGDSQRLVLQSLARKANRRDDGEPGDGDSRGDVTLVVYLQADRTPPVLPVLRQGSIAQAVRVDTSDVETGLVRIETDCNLPNPVDALSGSRPVDRRLELLASEVVGLQFHYFDGQRWRDTWDSDREQSVPRAIDVSITMQASALGERSEARPADPETYRLVIALPRS